MKEFSADPDSLRYGLAAASFTALLSIPAVARAEPSVSLSHLPGLWLLAAGLSALLAWSITRLVRRTGRLASPLRFWGLALAFFVLLLVFLSPIIVGLGSILVTGRTM